MGDWSSDSEAWQIEQLSRGELADACGAGAPLPTAVGDALASMFNPSPVVGNRQDEVEPVEDQDPALFVYLSFPGKLGREVKKASHRPGMALRYYLKEASLIAMRSRCRLSNEAGQKIRMSYVPKAGETIRLAQPGAPLR